MKKSLLVLSLIAGLAIPGVSALAEDTLAPINSSGIVVIDLPSSSAEGIKLEIKQGRFAAESVGDMLLDAHGIDFRKGSLTSLGAEVHDGNFDNVLVDMLRLDTQAFSFDSLELLNHRRFVLDHPVTAAVNLKISEASFNRFFSNPKTIEKLEKAVAKKTGNLALITFSNPSIKFLDRNRVKFTVLSALGNAVAAPMEFTGDLAVVSGKLVFNKLQMTSNGVQLPVDLSDVFQKKLNEMIDLQKLGKNNFVIQASTVSISRGMMDVKGSASLNRLEFGN